MRERERAAGPDPDLVGADPPAAADGLGADHGDRDDGDAGLEGEAADAALGLAERARTYAGALGEDQHDVPARKDLLGGLDHVVIARAPVDGERPQRAQDPGQRRVKVEDLLLRDVVHRPPGHAGDHERIEEAAVVRGQDDRSLLGDVVAPDPAQAEVGMEERLEQYADDPVHERHDSPVPRLPVQHFVIHRTQPYPF